MDFARSKRLLWRFAAIYWAFALLIYLAAGEGFHRMWVKGDALSPSIAVGELVDGVELTQRLIAPASTLSGVDVMAGTYGRANAGTLVLTLTDEDGTLLTAGRADVSSLPDGKYQTIYFDHAAQTQRGAPLLLTITSQGCAPGNAVTLYAGTSVTTGRFDIVRQIAEADRYALNGEKGGGRLCVQLNGVQELTFYWTYWLIVAGVFAAAAAMCLRWWRMAKRGVSNPLVSVCALITRYGFLLRQLVARDFKAKYKRSVLGMFWSFLNPLLTMAVQYIVFSTLFKSDIQYFPVYLLCGIVFFNFFSEAVSVGMTSITGNVALIKKVYVPKYIYPISRVISSLINFGLACIPLLLMTMLTGLRLGPSVVLLLFDVLCLLGFVTGMVLLLTTTMTFFQDTQFLWGVVSMMWMYLTPIFYPETIIPQKFLTVYHMNPMYQYVNFARICIIDGGSPAPAAYLWCIVSSVVVLLVGIMVFKKHQDQFILQL